MHVRKLRRLLYEKKIIKSVEFYKKIDLNTTKLSHLLNQNTRDFQCV